MTAYTYLNDIEDAEHDQHPELTVGQVQPSPQPGDGDHEPEAQQGTDLCGGERNRVKFSTVLIIIKNKVYNIVNTFKIVYLSVYQKGIIFLNFNICHQFEQKNECE